MEERLNNQIEQLGRAVKNMEESFGLELDRYDELARDSIKSGQVQKFEFSIELYWKTLKRYILEEYGEEVKSPKPVLKKGLELGFYGYEDCEAALDMVDWRNELSHIYKKEQFEEMREKILEQLPVWSRLMAVFEKRTR